MRLSLQTSDGEPVVDADVDAAEAPRVATYDDRVFGIFIAGSDADVVVYRELDVHPITADEIAAATPEPTEGA